MLADVGYDLDTIHGRIGLDDEPIALLTRPALYSFAFAAHLAESADVLDALVALFWLNASVDVESYRAAIPSDLRHLLEQLELVDAARGSIAARVSILQLDGVLLLSDPLFRNRGDGDIEVLSSPGLVMPFHASSAELLERVRTPTEARTLLDVGSGSGALALVLARRYERVVGVDLSERAVAFARANALGNGIHAAFEVADATAYRPSERFSHAIFNAPCELGYRDETGIRAVAERVVRMVARAGAAFLGEGGLLQAHCIVPVPAEAGSVADYVADLFAGNTLEVDVRPVPDSPFALAPEALAERKLPHGSYLLQRPEEERVLVDCLLEAGIREVVPAVLDVRAAPRS